MAQYPGNDYPTIEESNERYTQEQLRTIIRRKIEDRIKSSGYKEMSEDKKRQLRDEIRKELMYVQNNSNEPEDKPSLKARVTNTIKNSYKSAKNFIDPPGRSVHYQQQYYYQDEEQRFQEQLRMAILLSQAEANQNDQETFGATAGPIVGSNARPKDSQTVKIRENVETNAIECGICFEFSTNSISYGCEHHFCDECVKTNLDTAIKEGLIDSMKCPDTDCEAVASQQMVKRIVSKQLFDRYENLQLKAAVGSLDDVVYCPIEGCNTIIEAEADIGIARCYKCDHTFCTNCSKPYHGSTDCELTEDERKQNIQKYQDELIAEQVLSEETQNMLAIEALQREDEEWLKRIVEEQQEIRLQEENEREEYERQQQEIRRQDEERARAEEEQRQRERLEYERMIRDKRESDRQEKIRLEQRRQQDHQSENLVKETSKPCPSCKAPIEKNGGCDRIHCSKCNFEFCWKCMRKWPGYDHGC